MIWFKDMNSRQLEASIEAYNFDDEFRFPQMMIDSPACDLALALKVFYLSDGYAYLNDFKSNDEEWNRFIEALYTRIDQGMYTIGEIKYVIPLSKVQKYKLEKDGIRNIFMIDIG